jgi:hypothetical protein
LVAGRPDESDFTGSDAVVDAMLIATLFWSRCYGCSLLCNGPPHGLMLALDANRTRSDRHSASDGGADGAWWLVSAL